MIHQNEPQYVNADGLYKPVEELYYVSIKFPAKIVTGLYTPDAEGDAPESEFVSITMKRHHWQAIANMVLHDMEQDEESI